MSDPIAEQSDENELKPILTDEPSSSGSSQRSSEQSLLRRLYSRFPSLRNPLYQQAAKNLALIITWYVFIAGGVDTALLAR